MSLIPEPASPSDLAIATALARLAVIGFGATLGPGGEVVGELGAEAIQYLSDRMKVRMWGDASSTYSAATAISRLSPDQLAESLTAHSRTEALASRAIVTATEVSFQHKAWFLGRVIANAAADEHELDIEELIVDSVAGLRPSHASVLAILVEPYYPADGSQPNTFWMERWIAERVSGLGEGAIAVLKKLEAAGLVFAGAGPALTVANMTVPTSASRVQWTITPFGRLLHERLIEASKDAQSFKPRPPSGSSVG